MDFRRVTFRLKRYGRKHSQTMIFVGALIVFCTFVFKEELGENWRATAEQVDQAERLLLITNRLWEIKRSIRWSEYRLKEQVDRYHAPDTPFDYMSLEFTENSSFATDAADYEADEQNSALLIDVLPSDGKAKTEFIEVKKALEDARSKVPMLQKLIKDYNDKVAEMYRVNNIERQSYNDFIHKYPQAIALRAETEPRVKMMDQLLTVVIRNGFDKNHKLRAELVERAKKIRERDKCFSNIALATSSVFYVIGWGFSLIGKLYGFAGEVGEA